MKNSKIEQLDTSDINKYKILFYMLGLVILVLYHMRFNLGYGDVVDTYGNVLKRGSEYFPEDGNVFEAIFNFTRFHYLEWSSRSVIEIVLIIVGHMPTICWHVLDILMVLLIGYCLDKLTHIKNQKIKYLSIFTFLMMYQVSTMCSAGWIATTINYSWVVATGLYVVLNIQRIRLGQKISAGSYIMALLAALFAMNHEQMNGLMLLCISGIFFYDIRRKEFKKLLLPFYIINIVEFILIYTCPGNASRRHTETISYYPIYEGYSFLHKVYEGICSMLTGLFHANGMAVITITVLALLIYLSFLNNQTVIVKIISIIVFAYSILKRISAKIVVIENNIFFKDYRTSIPATILGCLILVGILAVCCFNIKKISECIGVVWVLSAAAATKVILGFSVAFLVSGERTTIYMTFVVIMLALYLIQKYEDTLVILKKNWFCFGICLTNLMLFAWNYYYLC